MTEPLAIPALRLGRPYVSLDKLDLKSHSTGALIAQASSVHAGLIRRDLQKMSDAFAQLQAKPMAEILEICGRAAELFLRGTVPLPDGPAQAPEAYIQLLSATTGLPHVLCRRNMAKIHTVLAEMPAILRGLTRGLPLEVLDTGLGKQGDVRVSYAPATQSLGVVLPSNSPGVNSIWLPAVALKIPVVLKPGREEPWTPLRIIQALITAGCPAAAFSFYPTDHEGASTILTGTGRAIIFGDDTTIAAYASNPAVQVHGSGRSKVLIGEDLIDRWPEFLDVLVRSIVENGGRSCINASAIVVPRHGLEIAQALAERLAKIDPRPVDAEDAQLAGFANPKMAQGIDATITEGLATVGARDVTAELRGTKRPRLVELGGATYLRPTIVLCDTFAHPLANREFLFPYASVVAAPQAQMLAQIGPSLVVTAITQDQAWIRQLLASPHVDRLNVGALATCHVRWDQPHEGNLFEFLYRRRAVMVEGT